MNNRNVVIEDILKYKYGELSEKEIASKRKWLKGQSNKYIYGIYFNEIKAYIELDDIVEESLRKGLCEDFEFMKYN